MTNMLTFENASHFFFGTARPKPKSHGLQLCAENATNNVEESIPKNDHGDEILRDNWTTCVLHPIIVAHMRMCAYEGCQIRFLPGYRTSHKQIDVIKDCARLDTASAHAAAHDRPA